MIDRRRFLHLLALYSATTGLAALPGCGRPEPEPQPEPQPEWERLLDEQAAAVAIGRLALAQLYQDEDSGSLIEALELRASELDTGSRESLEHARTHLRQRHGDDLRQGRLLSLNGYILSQTELQLTALIALNATPADRP